MRELIYDFPKQMNAALEIAKAAQLNEHSSKINKVLIAGLGGSGIGASIVSNLIFDKSSCPIVINKGYILNQFVDKETMVVCCSYSGNTEETLNILKQAHDRQAKVSVITSGGAMLDFARANQIDFIQIPGDMPPRACLGYSMTQLCRVLTFHGIMPQSIEAELEKIPEFLTKVQNDIDQEALVLAKEIAQTMPILYADERFEGVVVRYRQQLNENSKMLCNHHVIPEMNHNEMVGWRDKHDNISVIFLNSPSDYGRNVQRKEINEAVIRNFTPKVFNIHAKGSNLIEHTLYFIHFGDILSIHLAELRHVDAMDIKVIEQLKAKLAETKW